MKKALVVMGTRPEVIKLAPVVHALRERMTVEVCATSQHRTMQDQMMALFDLEADYDLDIMRPNQDLFYVSSALLNAMKSVLEESKPDVVFVQGDTTTSFITALAAFYCQIPVAHVEAGLRTNDLAAPFPEEGNRQLTSRLAAWHFAPTQTAKDNLIREGILSERIVVTGNTVIDALLWVRSRLDENKLQAILPVQIAQLINAKADYVLITGHRRENHGQGFINICEAIATLAAKYPTWHFVYPVHLNPNVQEPVYELLTNLPNIHLIAPQDYEPFVYLMDHCKIVLTDSGGVQEEAPSLGKPVLVMRETTERPEGVEAGTAKLVGTDPEQIINNVSQLIDDKALYQQMATSVNPYGDGQASTRIVEQMVSVKQEGVSIEEAFDNR